MLEKLRVYQREFIKRTKQKYERYLFEEVNFDNKLLGIIGARGVGKTTFLIQYLKKSPLSFREKLYVSVDVVGIDSLFDIAFEFYKEGGKLIIFDEVHKYANFEQELKNIYDMLDLQVIFSGSSALKLDNAKADLSRRAIMYQMQGLSFREFLEIKNDIKLPTFTLDEILKDHINIADELLIEFDLYNEWKEYLIYGYYPFYFENKDEYLIKLSNTINTVIESDIPSIFSIEYSNIVLLKKLVTLICESNPYKPNMKTLLEKMDMKNDYNRLYKYMYYLHQGKIINIVKSKSRGDSIFTKPEKLYLNNTNLHYAYCNNAEIGTIREVFFNSMLFRYDVQIPQKGDFLVNQIYIFEIGGKNKTKKQIKNIENSYIVSDDIEVGKERKIPLWLFGFLY
jgi:predicted AAA+ superfamily ATPase